MLEHSAATTTDGTTCTASIAHSLLHSSGPFVLVDHRGVICEVARPLSAKMPSLLGLTLEQAFQTGTSDSTNAEGNIYGLYPTPTGEQIPVVLQPVFDELSEGHKGRVVFVVDGTPFRDAEAERFRAASFSVLRINAAGVVWLAKRSALEMFGKPQRNVVGLPFTSLFPSDGAPQIQDRLDSCASGHTALPVDVTLFRDGTRLGESVRLLLMPDLGPGRLPLGTVAVILSVSVDRARDAIRKVALDPAFSSAKERFGSILEILRSVVDFDHAVYGVYAEDATLYRAVFIEREDDIVWPSRWMELPPTTVKTFVESGQTWRGTRVHL
jgi:PAS domain-containing protein